MGTTGKHVLHAGLAGLLAITACEGQSDLELDSEGLVLTPSIRMSDFDHDGRSDLVVWRPSTGNWAIINSSDNSIRAVQWGSREDIPVPGDYDGDGKTDVATWRVSTGNWAIKKSSDGKTITKQWGAREDIPVPGDYDGDHKTDLATWRPSTGTWAIIKSSTGSTVHKQWGAAEDVPVPGDYDKDGKTDFATWRPSTGTWAVIKSSTGSTVHKQWGAAEDVPVPGDYDKDGKTDFATWRPSTGTWAVVNSSNGSTVHVQWGLAEDQPVPGDYDKDGKTDFATWRPSTGNWAIKLSATGTIKSRQWGLPGDIPVPQVRRAARVADFDGDRKADIATWRPSTGNWAIQNSGDNGIIGAQWGQSTDLPVFADFDGDGRIDLATWRTGTGNWAITKTSDGKVISKQWGAPADLPVPADYDGDRKADIAIWRPASGEWAIIRSSDGKTPPTPLPQWGSPEDMPLPRDYDGDGKADLATWRPSTGNWAILNSSNGTTRPEHWGQDGDVPVPADYDGDGKADLATWRPSTRNWALKLSSDGSTRNVVLGGTAEGFIPVPADYDGDGKADVAVFTVSSGIWIINKSSTGEQLTTQWGLSEDMPAGLSLPAWPWYGVSPALGTMAAAGLTVGDSPVATEAGLWEFSALVAPPGTSNCAAGRRFHSGSSAFNGGTARLFASPLTCSGSSCASDIFGSIPLPASDQVFSDQVMTRLPDGTLILARDVTRKTPTPRNGTGIWASVDCGTTWQMRSFIDPSDVSRFPPPEYPADPAASYGLPQTSGINGGWDREEVFADPLTGNIYMAAAAEGGALAGQDQKYADTLLIRSTDAGMSWRSTLIHEGPSAPTLMTSMPGVLLMFQCWGGAPYLYWSRDGGATVSTGFRVSSSMACAGAAWSTEGSQGISRIRSANGVATVRVSYPSVLVDGRQVLRVFNVSLDQNDALTSTYIQTISATGAHVVQATVVEPDVSLVPLNTNNTALVYWKEISTAGTSIAARAMLMRDDATFSPAFDVSTVTATGGGPRSWANTTKTGDYAKGSFYFDAATSRLNYLVPWLEIDASNTTVLRTKIFNTQM
jgi:hypothetical protein